MRHHALILLLGLAAFESLFAQDRERTLPAPRQHLRIPRISRQPRRTLTFHLGDSPFTPPDDDDTLVVVDSSAGLDTGCTYHSGGPLVVHVPVYRYVGPTRSDGTLQDPAGLVSRHVLSPTVHLRLPVYDVDVNGNPTDPSVPPEVDHVYFNGQPIGQLTGDNDIWKLNEFEIPIKYVRFPSLGSAPGLIPDPADNVITISIDDASGGVDNWCTEADWVEVDYHAVAPIFLVHGTGANGTTWDPDFTGFLKTSGVPWSNDINLPPEGAILDNATRLANSIGLLGDMFGATKCHIVAHSKGGLDARAFLNNDYDPNWVRVLSLYTLSTPHHGTILADIIEAERAASHPESSNVDLQTLIDIDSSALVTLFTTVSNSIPQGDALRDQTTEAMAQFNSTYPSIPGNILFYNYGADADLNGDGVISRDEMPQTPIDFSAVGTLFYRILGTTASIQITRTEKPGRLWGENTFTSIDVGSTSTSFIPNDIIVTDASAHGPGGTYLATRKANHSSIKSSDMASQIVSRILQDFPNQ